MAAVLSLREQIDAVEREIGMRAKVYPGRVAAGKMSAAEQAHETAAMRCVLRTLEWLQSNEQTIKDAVRAAKERAAARAATLAHPSVSVVMAAFPDAEIRDIRPIGGRT